MTIRLVTDSACDLPADLVAQHGIEIVPLSIRFGDDEFVDRTELSAEAFYRLMSERPELPQTAAPAPGAFEAAYRRLAAGGATGVCVVNLSSALSATMQSALTAAAAVVDEIPIRVLDSRSLSAGQGTIVVNAAEAAAAGADLDDLAELVGSQSHRTRMYGTLDTLENLKKGGRIGGAQALLGTVLSIKPLLDLSTGAVEEAGRQRTRRKALQWLRDKVSAERAVEHLTVCSGQSPDLDEFLAMFEGVVPHDQIAVTTIGPVIGSHGGPRVMAVTYQLPA